MTFLQRATSALIKPNIIRHVTALDGQKRYASWYPCSKELQDSCGHINGYRGSSGNSRLPILDIGNGLFQQHILSNTTRMPSSSKTTFALMSYDNSNKVHKKIHDLITNSKKKVFVFMKGDPSEPLCRYSGVVVQILDAYGIEFDSYNVLDDSDVRQEIKSYSDWPTIPQVYKDGTFIGGCDILLQMHQSGELKQTFGAEGGEQKS